MRIAFHGAAGCVTGSKHLLYLDNGQKILLDCGLFQGMAKQTAVLNAEFGFSASEVDIVILSHAHIDHSGLLPKLVKEGFSGAIYCTPATADLASILLEDSAEIQRDDTKFINKRRSLKGLPLFEPLYNLDDAREVSSLMKKLAYNQWQQISPDVQLLFTDAGHIIGSASVHLRIKTKKDNVQLTFSGDVGRYRDAILCSPQLFPQADYIILESTYGDKLHQDVNNATDILFSWIKRTCLEKKGKLIIPAFSVGRTQELLYYLNSLINEKRIPVLPVFVDSPLSRQATEVIRNHPENFNRSVQKLLRTDHDPFDFPGLQFTTSSEDSKKLNFLQEPAIIISASGMADSGRVKHHIMNNIHDPNNTILLVGYCEPMSLGGRLGAGQKQVKIFGEFYEVKAEVGSMHSMSAHGDYEDFCQYLSCQVPGQVNKLFLVHGEPEVMQTFQQRLLKKGFREVIVPALHEVKTLTDNE